MPEYVIEMDGKVLEKLNSAKEISSSRLLDYANNHYLVKKALVGRKFKGVELKGNKVIVESIEIPKTPEQVREEETKKKIAEAQAKIAAGVAGTVKIIDPKAGTVIATAQPGTK